MLPTGALKFSPDGLQDTQLVESRLPEFLRGREGEILAKLIPKLEKVECHYQGLRWGGSLYNATSGARNCSTLTDVFSFVALVNIALRDEEFLRFMKEKTVFPNYNSSSTVAGRTRDGGKSRRNKTFKCVHFEETGEEGRVVMDFEKDTDIQGAARIFLYREFMDFLEPAEGELEPGSFKSKVKIFMEKFTLTRLTDRFLNDFDDDLLFVLLSDMGVQIKLRALDDRFMAAVEDEV